MSTGPTAETDRKDVALLNPIPCVGRGVSLEASPDCGFGGASGLRSGESSGHR